MEVKYTVKFSNSMEDMSETSYQMPEQNSFDSMKEAMDFVATEAEKAKTLLLALPDAGCYGSIMAPYHSPSARSRVGAATGKLLRRTKSEDGPLSQRP